MSQSAAEAVEEAYRAEWGRILAALIGLVGDFDLAEGVSTGSLHGGGRSMASFRRSGVSARLDHPDGAAQGNRPYPDQGTV